MKLCLEAGGTGGALPPPLAGEGWGEGSLNGGTRPEERALTRAFGATSPASGRGGARSAVHCPNGLQSKLKPHPPAAACPR
ncbi:hypothetical protein C7U89_06145 [Bradyrhizobium sp. WBOS4]|nr:hypothetical protein [Bradyrhizobium sp. WBOS8]MDD1582531.1 hypothetical protein [Bradyrhizobium sp. WBOS4]UUO50831.1 hypothetical protein DCM78_30350 [Bradyrhizobium sp. WBOS04]UUO58208.1 hypothetical protein DCM80_02850 [Bradyrhizobium sp. WBOS08]